MAYDRLLERLYLVDEGWIIKGATALLARDIGVRGTDRDVIDKRIGAVSVLLDIRHDHTGQRRYILGLAGHAEIRTDQVDVELDPNRVTHQGGYGEADAAGIDDRP